MTELKTETPNLPTMNPLVSVIIITYNASNYVLEALESAKAQTYQNIELIVSDDCSTDNTLLICAEWLTNNQDRFIKTTLVSSGKNSGVASNYNRALAFAQGEWIKSIGGDDALVDNCIELNIEFILKNKDVKIVHSNYNLYANNFTSASFIGQSNLSQSEIDKQSSFINTLKDTINFNNKFLLGNGYLKTRLRKLFTHDKIIANDEFQILLRYNVVSAPTVFFHKSIYLDFNGFDESIPMIEDLPMWLRITKAGIKMHFLNKTTINYRMHQNSITGEQINNTIFNNHFLKLRNLYVKYVFKDISSWEKFYINYEYYRLVVLSRLGLNKSNSLNWIIFKITYFPTLVLEKLAFGVLIRKINNCLINR